MGSERETCLMNARISELVERFDEMAAHMKKVVMCGEPLNVEERNLLAVAYKNVVGPRRAAWRILQSVAPKAKNELEEKLVKAYKDKVEKELTDVCDEVLKMLDNNLLVKASQEDSNESKIFYYKMKGDFFRYKIEAAEASARGNLVSNAEHSYSEANDLAVKDLSPIHPSRLGLALNYSVFLYEIKKDSQRALDLAKKAFDEAAELFTMEGEHAEAAQILQFIRDNITLWMAASGEGQEGEDGQ